MQLQIPESELTNYKSRDPIPLKCEHCQKIYHITKHKVLDPLRHNRFCSPSCSSIYHNQHKVGYNRSKLEIYLEENLKKELPSLDIKFNDRISIGYELDIYIPSKQLAFEINGIFHYKPIFKNFYRTIEIDQLKQKICQDKNIRLQILNISHLRQFQLQHGIHYLNLIKEQIIQSL